MENELIFYEILYKIVQAWQPTYHADGHEQREKRINSFAVIDSEIEMFAEGLGKDGRYKPTENPHLYFNRSWDAAQYADGENRKDWPILYLWQDHDGENKIGADAQGIMWGLDFKLCLADQYAKAYQPGETTGAAAGQRPVEKIKANLRTLMAQLLTELANWVYYEATLTAGGTETGFMHNTTLDSLVGSTYSAIKRRTPMRAYMQVQEQTEIAVQIDTADMVGVYANVHVQLLPCQAGSFVYGATENAERLDHPTNASA